MGRKTSEKEGAEKASNTGKMKIAHSDCSRFSFVSSPFNYPCSASANPPLSM